MLKERWQVREDTVMGARPVVLAEHPRSMRLPVDGEAAVPGADTPAFVEEGLADDGLEDADAVEGMRALASDNLDWFRCKDVSQI